MSGKQRRNLLWIGLLFAAIVAQFVLPPPAVPAFRDGSDGFILVIDAGHGGEDGGAVSASGVRESDLNLAIALRAADLASFLGVPNRMIRTEDVSVYSDGCTSVSEKKSSDLRNRVKTVNAQENAILLSIHQNHFSQPKYRGAQVFYGADPASRLLAEAVQASLRENLDRSNRRKAKKCAGVYLMDHVTCPALLVECGFLSNVGEAELLQSGTYQKKLALAILCPIADSGKAVTDSEI